MSYIERFKIFRENLILEKKKPKIVIHFRDIPVPTIHSTNEAWDFVIEDEKKIISLQPQSDVTKGRNLASATKNHVTKFTANSRKINERLLTGDTSGAHIKHLDLVAEHPVGSELHVYSGLGFNPAEHHDKNGVISSPAYVSTSTNRVVAKRFASDAHRRNIGNSSGSEHHLLHIHMQPGDHGAFISHLARGDKQLEDEVLLPRNTRLKMKSKEVYHYSTKYDKENPPASWTEMPEQSGKPYEIRHHYSHPPYSDSPSEHHEWHAEIEHA